MRILHLVHQYPPHYVGGTEHYTQTVAAAQVETGHSVAVFVPSPSDKAPSSGTSLSELESGVRVYRVAVGERSRTKVFLQIFRQPYLQEQWRTVLDSERPQLVHIEHLMGLPLGLVTELINRRIPYVVTLHDYWYVCANAQLLTNFDNTVCGGPDDLASNCARCALARVGARSASGIAPILAPLMNRRNNQTALVLKEAKRIIAPTEFVRDCYITLMPGDITIDVVPHGIDLPQNSHHWQQESGISRSRADRLHVGYLGSIARQKGLHVLIRAMNALPAPDASLTIYGDLTAFPTYVSELRELIDRPGIILAGKVDREALWTAIAGFDVVVLPTLWYETSVLVIDEVNALGIPVIGSDIGVMRERIADGVNGRLFEPGDTAVLRGILSDLIAMPETLAEWRRGIKPVNTISDHLRALEEIYADALNAL